MKTLIIILFAHLTTSVFGQYRFESDYQNFITKISSAKTNHFKSISIFMYKNGKTENEKLFSKEIYSENGNITSKLEHYDDYKYYKETSFTYDKRNLLTKIVTKSNFQPEYFQVTEIGYNDKGQLSYIMTLYTKLENPKFDTLYYSYNDNGSIHYKFWSSKRDTTYYHYDMKGDIINTSKNPIDLTDTRILDKYGCYIGDKKDTIINGGRDETYFKTTYVCDTACNVLIRTEELYRKGKWVLYSTENNKYENGNLVEEKVCQCKSSLLDRCKGKIKFRYNTKYEYTDNRFLNKTTDFNEKGKIIEVRKYVREVY
jgi:hypothetical protein